MSEFVEEFEVGSCEGSDFSSSRGRVSDGHDREQDLHGPRPFLQEDCVSSFPTRHAGVRDGTSVGIFPPAGKAGREIGFRLSPEKSRAMNPDSPEARRSPRENAKVPRTL
jgi:hypothetical protein